VQHPDTLLAGFRVLVCRCPVEPPRPGLLLLLRSIPAPPSRRTLLTVPSRPALTALLFLPAAPQIMAAPINRSRDRNATDKEKELGATRSA